MRTSETINELAAALAAAQGEMQNAAMSAENPHFKSRYADLAAIRNATIPALSKNGLSILQAMSTNSSEMLLTTRLMHSSGQWIESAYPIIFNERPHVMGSAITYAKRYSWAAITGIAAEEDEDGNAAQEGAKNGQRNSPFFPNKRTRQEISDDANRKRQQVRDVDADILQIDNLTALARYEREVLTPEFMASLGMKQWAVEQRVGERRRELEDWQNAAEREPPDDMPLDECKEYLDGATSPRDLVKRAKNPGYLTALQRLTDEDREALRALYKEKLQAFGRKEAAQ